MKFMGPRKAKTILKKKHKVEGSHFLPWKLTIQPQYSRQGSTGISTHTQTNGRVATTQSLHATTKDPACGNKDPVQPNK